MTGQHADNTPIRPIDSFTEALERYMDEVVSDTEYVATTGWETEAMLSYSMLTAQQRGVLIALINESSNYIESLHTADMSEHATSVLLYRLEYNAINTVPGVRNLTPTTELYKTALSRLRDNYIDLLSVLYDRVQEETLHTSLVITYLLMARSAIEMPLPVNVLNNTKILPVGQPPLSNRCNCVSRKTKSPWGKEKIDSSINEFCMRISLLENFTWVTETIINILQSDRDERSKLVNKLIYGILTLSEIEDGLVFNNISNHSKDINEYLAIISGTERPNIGVYTVIDVVDTILLHISMYRYAAFNISMTYKKQPVNKVLLWSLLDFVDESFTEINKK